jgi:hypothetical protein
MSTAPVVKPVTTNEIKSTKRIKDNGKRVTWNKPVVTGERIIPLVTGEDGWIIVKRYRGKNKAEKK